MKLQSPACPSRQSSIKIKLKYLGLHARTFIIISVQFIITVTYRTNRTRLNRLILI